MVATIIDNTSSIVKGHTPHLDNILTLSRKFEDLSQEHSLARSQCSLTQDAISTLDSILENLQNETVSATSRLNNHRAALNHYRKLEIRHDEVMHAFEAAIEVEKREQHAQKSSVELLEQKKCGWQEGRVVC